MYTKKYIDVITLALVVLIFVLINIYQFQIQSNIEKILNQNQIQNTQETSKENSNEEIVINETVSNNISNDIINNTIEENVPKPIQEPKPVPIAYPSDWYISIPSIDLVAQIKEGTTEEILNKSVGHFEETPTVKGNVCLAAHNRGYEKNFFENLKKLLLNDVITYQFGNIKKTYTVSNITIIKETDLSYIDNSNENKITLITCVENEPEYRLCIQAKEIK